jgi:hypothetical protein
MANQNDTTRNAIIKQVELHWPKLNRPTSPFGEEIYDLQCRVPVKRKAELEQFGKTRTVDDAPGMVVLNVRKKANKSDGTPARKPIVVDGARDPLDPDTIGNGSIGNIRLRLNDYEIRHPKTGAVTKSGTKAVLEAVQVTTLKVFTPKGGDMNDFDEEEMEIVEDEQDSDDTPPAKPVVKSAAKKPAAKKPAAEQDDGFGEDDEETDTDADAEPEEPAAPAKKVNPGLAAYQAKKAAEKAAVAKKPVPAVGKKPASRGNSDY